MQHVPTMDQDPTIQLYQSIQLGTSSSNDIFWNLIEII